MPCTKNGAYSLSYTLAGTHIPIALHQQKPVNGLWPPNLMVYPQWGMSMAGCIKKLPGLISWQFLKLLLLYKAVIHDVVVPFPT